MAWAWASYKGNYWIVICTVILAHGDLKKNFTNKKCVLCTTKYENIEIGTVILAHGDPKKIITQKMHVIHF